MEEDLKKALDTLRAGGTILYPTDTVWGIGCDATNSKAVKKVFELKQRADSKSVIMLVDSIARLDRYVETIPEAAEQLLEVAVSPMTIIYDHPVGVAKETVAPDGSAAFRITSETFSQQLCRRFGKPIVSTSANISGNPTPRIPADIDPAIKEAVDYAVTYGADSTTPAKPSEIIKVSDSGVITLIRP